MKTQIAGIVYGYNGDVLREFEAKLSEATNNYKTAQKMVKAKLEQLDILDAAINYAEETLDTKIIDANSATDIAKYKSIVGLKSDKADKDGKVTLYEMHDQIQTELNGLAEGVDDYENEQQLESWRKDGLIKYVMDMKGQVDDLGREAQLFVEQLLGAAGAINLKDDSNNDMNRINKLIGQLNKLLVKYGLDEFDPETVKVDNEHFTTAAEDLDIDENDKHEKNRNCEIVPEQDDIKATTEATTVAPSADI